MTDWLKEKWCGLFHGGGTILRDCYGRINWQCVSCGRWSTPVDKQTEKLETALAQPEQEFKYTPYGLRSDENGKLSIGEISQRDWVGLTDEQFSETYNELYTQYTRDDVNIADFILIARAIEAKFKENNT